MKKTIFTAAVAGLFLMSCGNSNETTTAETETQTDAPDMHTSQTSIDYAGTYKGTVPCADCEGIETTLTLNQDNSFTMVSHYLGKGDDNSFTDHGTFAWKEDGNTIELTADGEAPRLFKVGENKVFWLDADGNEIQGDLAPMYILTKE